MSRHRNVRSTNFYSEECEGFDDVYGHSVEDDYCVSPSVAEQFLYDRSRRQQMSVFLGHEEEIAEEDEGEEGGVEPQMGVGNVPKSGVLSSTKGLSDVDQARLQSCLEEVRNVVGDSIAEQSVIEAVLRCEFDVEKALNMVLNNATGVSESGALKITRTDQRKDKDVCSNCSLYFSPSVCENNASSVEACTAMPQGKCVSCKVCHKDSSCDSSLLEVAIGTGEGSDHRLPSGGCLSLSLAVVNEGKDEAVGGADGQSVDISSRQGLPEIGPVTLCAPSDSEDEGDVSFPSLCSLVIHNTSSQGVTPSSVERKSEDSGPSKDKKPIPFNWENLQMGDDDDSEDSGDDFSSLCSLVVHNQNKKGPALTKPHEPFVMPPLFPPHETNVSQKTAAPSKLQSHSNSSSEEDDFSSLQSLVVRNRSAPVENEAINVDHNWAQPLPKASSSDCSGKLGLTKEALIIKESDSEDDDNYSSLCSLVIHNRNTHSSGQDTIEALSAPLLVQKTAFVQPSEEINAIGRLPEHIGGVQGGSFVIPPLLVTSKQQTGSLPRCPVTESEESEEGDDYVIDLCGTLKSLDVESIASVEEETETQNDHIQLKLASQGEVCDIKDIKWSIKEEDWVCQLADGIKLLDVNSRKLSPFGRVLCKNWECLKPIECPKKKDSVIDSDITTFLFDKESPDDICKRLRSQKFLIHVKTPNTMT